MDFNLSLSLQLLERTPASITALLGGLPPEWTECDEGPGTWSPRAVVAHLIQADRTNWMVRARLIRERGMTVPLPGFDPHGQVPELQRASLAGLLASFSDLRRENLATLASWDLGDDDLALEGVHPEFGRVTLAQLLATWTAHDLVHLAQISRVLAKQYRAAVGPWRAYLPILDR